MLLKAIHVACFTTKLTLLHMLYTHRSDGGGNCGGGSVGGFNHDGGFDDYAGCDDHGGPFAIIQAPVSYYITLNYNSLAWSLLFLNKLIKCVLIEVYKCTTHCYSAVLHSS